MTLHRRVSVLGSTGSIGLSTLDLFDRAAEAGSASVDLVAITAGTKVDDLIGQARRLDPERAVIADERLYGRLKEGLAGTRVEAAAGADAVVEAAQLQADWVMSAIVGSAGLAPTLAAARTGATLALANKESLICAGPALLETARRSGSAVVPVDSEHSAIFQALAGAPPDRVARLILTASGGPFRTCSRAEMARMRPEQALAHPKWSMGPKISIDSATLMNKGLEMIEAAYLFGQPEERIEVVVHPESIVHSLVEFVDGSTLAQLGPPDMRTPIAAAFAWPDRLAWAAPRLDLAALGGLTFEAPDALRFPALRLARAALRAGGSAPNVLNAANEVAVGAFLERRIGFLDIAAAVEVVLERTAGGQNLATDGSDDVIGQALLVDAEARRITAETLTRFERAA
ncbi:MAG: 1-deoxy-D-xylulose-5-phosphate reductoisomerase [Pseudomonadota bacterium]|nr:1-deoxy-D-xylulose-5-phosphate reductoisomerase [Pseudomonadota bacterium]